MTTVAHDAAESEMLVRTYYRYVDEGNAELVNLFHLNAIYKRPGYDLIVGRAALQSFYGGERVISSGTHSLTHVFATFSKVAVEGTFRGVLKSGVEVSLPFSDFFDVGHDGTESVIMSRRTYFDDQQV